MLSAAEQGRPVDTENGHGQLYYEDESDYSPDYEESYDSYSGGLVLLARLGWGPAWLASAVVAVLLSLLICWIVKNATMKSVAAKREARKLCVRWDAVPHPQRPVHPPPRRAGRSSATRPTTAEAAVRRSTAAASPAAAEF